MSTIVNCFELLSIGSEYAFLKHGKLIPPFSRTHRCASPVFGSILFFQRRKNGDFLLHFKPSMLNPSTWSKTIHEVRIRPIPKFAPQDARTKKDKAPCKPWVEDPTNIRALMGPTVLAHPPIGDQVRIRTGISLTG